MPDLILSEEQAKTVSHAGKPVTVRDSKGNILGSVSPFWTEADITEAKRRLASGERGVPAERVEAHLRALEEEWQRTGGFDKEYMHKFLERLRGEDGR
jgi:hypothetical protein